MPYLADYKRGAGLGFENTNPASADAAFMVGPFDVGSWDWREWALAAVAVYVLFGAVTRGTKRAAAAVTKPIKARKKKQARVAAARRALRDAEEGAF